MIESEKTIIHHQLERLELSILSIDELYTHLTSTLKKMSPLLRKKIFHEEDQIQLRELLTVFRSHLEEFDHLIRRSQGERQFLYSEIVRQKNQTNNTENHAMTEGELLSISQNLAIREKCLTHLNELTQLLESIIKVGEMTEFDENFLTEIVSDLKNLAN